LEVEEGRVIDMIMNGVKEERELVTDSSGTTSD